MIHPTAHIHSKAQIDPSAQVGPYAVIDEHVTVGPNCWVGPHVHLTGHTLIGRGNKIYSGAVLGEAPQDLKYKDEPTRLIIGDNNVFREHVTVHRSNKLSEDTVIGSNNFLMANSHVGHNSQLCNQVILANGALIAGHVLIQDRAFISGNCMVHQFVRIGTLSFMQGGSGVSKDLPPFTVARGNNGISGLNTVGLRRSGFTGEQRLELRRLYHFLFRTHLKWKEALERSLSEFHGEPARILLEFVQHSKRGICADKAKRKAVAEEMEQDQ